VLANRKLAACLGTPLPQWQDLLEGCIARWKIGV